MGFTVTPNESGIVINGSNITFPGNTSSSEKNYTVTYSDAKGCSISKQVTVLNCTTSASKSKINIYYGTKILNGQVYYAIKFEFQKDDDWDTLMNAYKNEDVTFKLSMERGNEDMVYACINYYPNRKLLDNMGNVCINDEVIDNSNSYGGQAYYVKGSGVIDTVNLKLDKSGLVFQKNYTLSDYVDWNVPDRTDVIKEIDQFIKDNVIDYRRIFTDHGQSEGDGIYSCGDYANKLVFQPSTYDYTGTHPTIIPDASKLPQSIKDIIYNKSVDYDQIV